jgi:hypothetical protein
MVIPHEEEINVRADGSLDPDAYWKAKIIDIKGISEDTEVVRNSLY